MFVGSVIVLCFYSLIQQNRLDSFVLSSLFFGL